MGESGCVKNKALIRGETSADAGAIAKITADAFKTMAISNHTGRFTVEFHTGFKADGR
jgi:hypothetical protein